MSNWWYILVVVVFAILGILFCVRYRRSSERQAVFDRRDTIRPNRDFVRA